MKNQHCQFENCNDKPISSVDIQEIYSRFELPAQNLPDIHWCHKHALQSAERAYVRLCGETRVTDPDASARLARLKEIEAEMNAPSIHYPTSSAGRLARLAEIEAQMNAPTLEEREAQKRLADLQAKRKRLSELQELQRKNAPLSPRFLRIKYLEDQGVDTTLFNI